MSEQPIQLDTLHVQVQEVSQRKLPNGPDRMFVQTDGAGKVLMDFADGLNEWGKALELNEEQYEALRQEAFHRELADLQDIPTYAELYPYAGNGGAITSPNGNTLGRVNGETPAMGKAADDSNADVEIETPEEGITGEQMLDGLQLGLDIVGLIPVIGEFADVANAGISLSRGDYAGAALALLSAIPFVGYLGTAGKVGRYGTKAVAEASAKAANEMANRAAKEAAEKTAKEGSERAIKRAEGVASNSKDGAKATATRAAEDATSRISNDTPDGSFSISDWTGYPAGVPVPQGPFRLLEGAEYNSAREAANKANRALRREQGLAGKPVDVHEINPVKFGGSPTEPANKVILPRDVHRQQVTPWWNQLQKDLGDKP